MIVGLEWADSAAYSCSHYDSNGNKISTKTIGILTLKRGNCMREHSRSIQYACICRLSACNAVSLKF